MKKKLLLFTAVLISFLNFSQTQIYFDDFETYTVPGQLVCQNPDWDTWTHSACTDEDADISNSQFYNGSQSVRITRIGSTNNDIVFITKNLPTGKYKIGFYMYIPSGRLGYFNTLQVFDPVNANYEWGMQVYFDFGGNARIDGDGANAASFSFSYDTWFYNEIFVDLDEDWAEYYFNNALIHGWQWSKGWDGNNNLNQLEGNNLFAWGDADAEYFVDDYNFIQLNPPENLQASFIGNDANLSWDTPPTKALTGYNIYRDGIQVNVSPVVGNSYTDSDLDPGSYSYYVTAVYDDGIMDDDESGPSNTVTLTLDFYNFEAYTPGDQVACDVGSPWDTWSSAPCGSEDAYIVNTQAYSGSNSIEIASGNDLVFMINDYTSGKYKVSHYNYVPTGNLGFFNVLQDFAGAGSSWGLQVFFNTAATATVDAGGASSATFTYSYDTWNYNEVFVDLDLDYAEYYFNGNLIVSWVWSTGTFGVGTLNQLGGVNLFAWDDGGAGNPTHYYDDFGFSKLDPPENLNFSNLLDDVHLYWDAPSSSSLSLLGYNVYRDGVQINGSLVTSNSYNDMGLSAGSYNYYVTSVYDDGIENDDESGPSNTVSVSLGVQNNLYFDGNVSNGYVDCGNDPTLNITGSITVEAWINIDGTTFKDWRRIVEKDWATSYFLGSGDGTNDFSISFCMDPDASTANVLQTGSNVIDPHVWNHVAGVWDGTNLYIYVNGILEASMPWSNTVDGSTNVTEIARHFGAGSHHFRGNMDEVRIWNVARTAAQLQHDMHRELINPASETNLVAYYQFNQTGGTNLPDNSANSNDGTLFNMDPANDWVTSTAPIPYYSVLDGNWDVDNTWATAQMTPVNDWARVYINHNVNLNQDQTLKDLVINGSLNINPGYNLTMDGDITNYSGTSGLVLEADASSMSSLIHDTPGIEGTVEEYILSQQWHFVSPPVSGATINTYFNIYLTQYNEPSDSWIYLVNPTSTPMTVTQGYGVWAADGYTGSTTVSFEGPLNNGDYTISSLSYTPISPFTGFNLIGNPFPSSLEWNNNWTSNNIDAVAYFYNGSQYVNWNRDGYGTATNGHIPPTQGFFVMANNASASITIPQSERIHGTQAFYKDSEILTRSMKLRVDGNEYSDNIIIAFNESATNDYDGEFDAHDIRGIEDAPQLYIISSESDYAVNVMNSIDEELVVPIGLEVGTSAIYSIAAEDFNFDENTVVILEDIQENSFTELSSGTSYQFTAEANNSTHRFNIHFKDGAIDIDEQSISGIQIYSFSDNVIIKSQIEISGEVVVYNVMGQMVKSAHMSNENLTSIRMDSGSGYYVVEVQTGKELKTQKVFIP